MTYIEALRYYGNQTKLGTAVGITQSSVSSWAGVIPAPYQYQLEIITGGALKVDDALRLPADRRSQVAALMDTVIQPQA